MTRSNTNPAVSWVRRSERTTRRPDRLGTLGHHDAVTKEPAQTTQSSTGRHAQKAQQRARRGLPRRVIDYCGRQGIEIWNPDDFLPALPSHAYQNPSIGLGNTGPFYLPPLNSAEPQCEPTITDSQFEASTTDSKRGSRATGSRCESTETNDSSSNQTQSESSQGDIMPLSDIFTQQYEALLSRVAEEREHRLQDSTLSEDSDDDGLDKWCWCQRGDIDDRGSVKCDNPDCSIGWYHKGCLSRRDKSVYTKYDLWLCTICLSPRLEALIAEEKDDATFPTYRTDGDAADAAMGDHVDADDDIGLPGNTPAATIPNSNAVAGTTTVGETAVSGRNEDPLDDMIYETSRVEDKTNGENGLFGDSENDLAMMPDDATIDEDRRSTTSSVRAHAAAQDGHEDLTSGVQDGPSQTFFDLTAHQDEHEPQALTANWHNAQYIDPSVLRTAGLLPPITSPRNAPDALRLPAEGAPISTPMSFSVLNSTSLSASAKLWTSPQTAVVPNQDGSAIQVKYKHGKELPSLPEQSECPRFLINCVDTDGNVGRIEVAVKLLKAFSRTLSDANGIENLCDYAAGLVGTIDIPQTDEDTMQSVVDYLKGDFLWVQFASVATVQVTTMEKKRLLNLVHIAHALRIEVLMKAAVHALCVSVLRRPQDWANNADNERPLNVTTFVSNPARRLLSTVRRYSILPGVTGRTGLPCQEKDRAKYCEMGRRTCNLRANFAPVVKLWLESFGEIEID
ncbi:Inhibitor of growth protein 3 [Exophiala xenobiotica]|nr:Inhibitor of growth protein 3 [Exophiala xenobiotica]